MPAQVQVFSCMIFAQREVNSRWAIQGENRSSPLENPHREWILYNCHPKYINDKVCANALRALMELKLL